MKIFVILVCVVMSLGFQARASVTLPKLVSNGMVLQRDKKITIWGWAVAGERVTIKFRGKTYRTTTLSDGTWRAALEPMPAGGPFVMNINTLILNDILVGDVWFCSGQSNMVLPMERVKESYPEEISGADFPLIRNFTVPTYSDVTTEHHDLPGGHWLTVTPQTVSEIGAVSYFFAKAIHTRYHVPVGIINSSVGGTPAEAWVSTAGLNSFDEYISLIKKFRDTAYVNKLLKPATGNTAKPAPETDPGLEGPVKWYDTTYVADDWSKFWLPGYWEDQGIKNLDGAVWFRKEIIVPHSMTGVPAKLFMGRIVDADQLYINGVLCGGTTYQYPPRRYTVPAGLLKPGKNIVVVRVINYSGKGGFVPDKPYYLVAGTEKVDLRGEWRYRIGQVFTPVKKEPAPFSAQNSPTGLYNTMVAPVTPYTIKGFTWYQGEANTGHPENYSRLMTALIGDWRTLWKDPALPFVFVQLANFMEMEYSVSESQWAVLRNEQRKVLAVPHTAMTVSIDLGEWNDIHPLNKKDVGERLALAAEHLAYGDNTIVYSGPLYQSRVIQGNKIVVTFSNTGSGMIAKGGATLRYFEIAGADHKFFQAQARIEGVTVVVWSDQVVAPAYVRYAWADNPERANLYNKEMLPASPFETE